MKIGPKVSGNGKTTFAVWTELRKSMTLHIKHPFDKKLEMPKDETGYLKH